MWLSPDSWPTFRLIHPPHWCAKQLLRNISCKFIDFFMPPLTSSFISPYDFWLKFKTRSVYWFVAFIYLHRQPALHGNHFLLLMKILMAEICLTKRLTVWRKQKIVARKIKHFGIGCKVWKLRNVFHFYARIVTNYFTFLTTVYRHFETCSWKNIEENRAVWFLAISPKLLIEA